MAISSTSTFELQRDQLIRRAMQLAGLTEAAQEVDSNDIAMAADFLGMELLAMQAEGQVMGTVERTTLPIVAGTFDYTLPADTLDVIVGPEGLAGTFYVPNGAELPVRAISRHEYSAGISTKATTAGSPTLVYIERHALVKLLFWPVPSLAGTFRYERQRLPRDMDTGARTLDLARKWQKAIVFAIAWQMALAKSVPMPRVQYLRDIAEAEKATVRSQDVEHGHSQFYVGRFY